VLSNPNMTPARRGRAGSVAAMPPSLGMTYPNPPLAVNIALGLCAAFRRTRARVAAPAMALSTARVGNPAEGDPA
jgi:hypothetical protein